MSPRVVVDAFLDPSNTANSIAQSVSRVINQYSQAVAPGHGRSPLPPVDRPGLHQYGDAYLGTGSTRGGIEINGRTFWVSGTVFAEVLEGGTLTHINTVANDDQPVSFASNGSIGNQVMLVSDGLGYIFDLNANTLTQITDVNFPSNARCSEFINGYFLVSEGAGSRRIQWSDPADGTSWPSLNFIDTSIAPDNLTSIIRSHSEIWALGYRTTSVLYDAGDGNTVFAPLQRLLIEKGSQGIFAAQRIDNSIMWIALNENGQGTVVRADAYNPQTISTAAVDVFLQRASTPTDARACAFQINGHEFYCLTLPREELSWVYDATTKLWTEWGHWDTTNIIWHPFAANCHVYAFSKHLVGSLYDGTIYEMSQDFTDDQLNALG